MGCKYGSFTKYLSYISHYSFKNYFRGAATHFHRPISYYPNIAAEQGLEYVRTDEPEAYDGISRTDEIPPFLYAEFRKRQHCTGLRKAAVW